MIEEADAMQAGSTCCLFCSSSDPCYPCNPWLCLFLTAVILPDLLDSHRSTFFPPVRVVPVRLLQLVVRRLPGLLRLPRRRLPGWPDRARAGHLAGVDGADEIAQGGQRVVVLVHGVLRAAVFGVVAVV